MPGDFQVPVVEVDKSRKGKEKAAKVKAAAKLKKANKPNLKTWFIQSVSDIKTKEELETDKDSDIQPIDPTSIAQNWMMKLSYCIKKTELTGKFGRHHVPFTVDPRIIKLMED